MKQKQRTSTQRTQKKTSLQEEFGDIPQPKKSRVPPIPPEDFVTDEIQHGRTQQERKQETYQKQETSQGREQETKQEKKYIETQQDIAQPEKYMFGKEHPPFSIKNLKEIVKEIRITRPRMRLVLMFNRAGKPELFTVDARKTYFQYLNGTYIIPQEDDPEEIHSGLQLSFYHQSLSSPISFKIPVQELQETVSMDAVEVQGNRYSIEYALHPELVKKFMLSQIIEKTMQGQDMQELFTKHGRLLLITLIVSAISLLLLLNYTGVLSNFAIW